MLETKQLLKEDWYRLMSLSGTLDRKLSILSIFNFRFCSIILIRYANNFYLKGFNRSAKLTALLNFLIFGIEVPPSLPIGPGLVIPHPQGIVLGAARIGSNFTVFHQVTLGAKIADFRYDLSLRPRIGNDVTLSVGAKVLGNVSIGNGVTVGANAVVMSDIPEKSTAVGVPARIV